MENQQISKSVNLLKQILGENLLGVYLYGSSIVGGLQKYSDLDLFVISDRHTTSDEKKQLEKELLQISGIYMESKDLLPIELTIAIKSEVNPWKYPPKFDFQYGDWLRKEFEKGNIEPWKTKEMPDLAILITQILLASKTIYGPDPKELLDPVPYKDFITATTKEIDSLAENLESDTRNVLLTFARIWSTVETDAIRSKPVAADWAVERLPEEYKAVMQRAQDACLGKEEEYWDDVKDKIKPCAEYMVSQIKEKASLLISFEDKQKVITLA